MSELADTISESVEGAGNSRINSLVAIFVAITATFMAFCNIKDGNICQGMQQAQASSLDSWSYYQAKSTKQTILENNLQMLQVQKLTGSDSLIKKFSEQIKRYDKEKAEIKKQAEDQQQLYNDLNLFDDQFDMTEAFLSISIALFGVTALTQKKWLLYFAGGLTILGIIFGLTAFLKISLHSDFISKILG